MYEFEELKNRIEGERVEKIPGEFGGEFQDEINEGLILSYNSIEMTDPIGEGASGKVFKGLYRQQEVAVKIITTPNLKNQLEEFKKELEIMKVVKSNYCVKLFGITIEPLCMVMEYCEKGSLYNILMKNTKIVDWTLALSFCFDMCHGLLDLHDKNIVHRDFKSLNLLVTNDFRVKVCDFGLSRSTSKDLETFTKLRGTMAYLAPEVFTGTPCTFKSDIFSVGIVLWELMKVCIDHKYEQPYGEYGLSYDFQIIVQSSMGLRPNIPKGSPKPFVDLYLQCCNGSPDERPNCKEVVDAVTEMKTSYEKDPQAFLANVSTGDIVFVKTDDVLQVQQNNNAPKKNNTTTGGFGGWGKNKNKSQNNNQTTT